MWPMITGLAGIVGAIGSAFAANEESESQKEINASQVDLSREQMSFQERMRDTAHQAAVKDLRAAGLNPILAANSAAAVPSGAMAQLQNPKGNLPERVLSSARALSDIKLTNEMVETEKSKQKVNEETAKINEAMATQAQFNTAMRLQEARFEFSKYGRWFLAPVRATMRAVGSLFGGAGTQMLKQGQ